MPMSLRNAAPPPTRIARSSTSSAVSPATALDCSIRSGASARPVAERGDGVVDERRRRIGLVLHRGDVLAHDGLVGQRLVEVLEPGRR